MSAVRGAASSGRALAGLALLVAAGGAAGQHEPRVSRPGEYQGYTAALYTEQQRQSIYLPLRDGTRLAVDIHRPATEGQPVATPHPVIWQHALSRRAPPDVNAESLTRQLPQLVKYGYVVVEVERRGLGASFGARRGYNDRTEARDAHEVTEWLARQPWSTGRVGVVGCSNTGDAAMHAASYAPPSLKAVMAGCFSWNKYDGFRRGGVPAQWGVGPEQPLDQQLRSAVPVDGDEDRRLLAQAIEQHRDSTPLAAMWRSMPYRDSWSDLVASRFWLEGSVATYRDQLQRSGAAFYLFGGWQDDFRREGLVAWANLAPSTPARVLIGPWLHCRHPGFDMLAEARRFFDRWLKGVDNGIDREAPIHVHVAGAEPGQAWRSLATWPPEGAPRLQQHLAPQRGLGAGGDHLLLASPTAASAARAELRVTAPTPCPDAGALTQPCSQAATGLRFTGPVLAQDLVLVGHPLVDLWVSSAQPDQAVFAYLEDLAPDGRATVLAEGRLKASLRALHRPPYEHLGLPWMRSLEADHQPLRADEPVRLQFDLLPLAHVAKAGHRLRLVVSANDPRERQPLGTGHVFSLWAGAAHPSVISLPLLAAAGGRSP